MKRIRLVKVTVQAHYVVDDGNTLVEAATEPTTVSAADWSTFPAKLESRRAEQEAEINRSDDA